MVKKQIISRFGTIHKGNYRINWLHQDIPGWVLELAPEEDRIRRAAIEESLEARSHLDEVGCIVTEPNDDAMTQEDVSGLESPPSEQPAALQSATAVAARKDGEVNLTITLNINLNSVGEQDGRH